LLLAVVTNTNDAGPGSLRQAIIDSNQSPNGESIDIHLPGATEAQPHRIVLQSPLPPIERTGATFFGFGTAPRSVLITPAPNLIGSFDGLVINRDFVLQFLAISGFRHGVVVNAGRVLVGDNDIQPTYDRVNAIYGNTGDGVRVTGSFATASIRRNSIYGNGGNAIDLGGDGPTPNDPGDADGGPNDLLNAPTILDAKLIDDAIHIRFSTQDLAPIDNGAFDFFLGSNGSMTGGGRFIGNYYTQVTDTPRIHTVVIGVGWGPYPADPAISATYSQFRPTSEFATPVSVQGAPIYVTSAADSGPGSLREAITLANANPDHDNIRFNLPAGQRRVQLLSGLPVLTGSTIIDGAVQPGYVDTDPIVIDGSLAPAPTDGFVIDSQEPVTIRGLGITGFRHGVVIAGGSAHQIGQATLPGSLIKATNLIFRNRGDGIRVLAGTGHTLRHSRLVFNGGLPVDLGGDGANPPDPADADLGPNGLGNPPTWDQVYQHRTTFRAVGSLLTQPATSYTLDFYAYPPTDSLAEPPTLRYLGSEPVPASTETRRDFDFHPFSDPVPLGWKVVAVATDTSGNTGEFSVPATVSIPRGYVINTNDSGPGSVRQVILDANARPGFDNIIFDLDFTGTIQLASPLPSITGPVVISNSGQPPTLRPAPGLDGAFDGLTLDGGSSAIYALTLTGFRHGILIRSSFNRIGWTFNSANRIFGNTGDGIRVLSGSNNDFQANIIHSNGGLPIDLGGDGPTPNDPLDADSGPNGLTNFPVVVSALGNDQGKNSIRGFITALPLTPYRLDLYVTPAGNPQDPRFINSYYDVTTDQSGTASFVLNAFFEPRPGDLVTLTATGDGNNASEFSPPVAISTATPSFAVTSPAPFGPGTLYQAIANAEFIPGHDVITFNLPGPGPHRIDLGSYSLPILSQQITIDGTTQPGFAGKPIVELNRMALGSSNAEGLRLTSGEGSVIKGLAIGGFGTAINAFAPKARIEGNYIGLDADGDLLPNRTGIIATGSQVTIGGLTPAARNVISGNSEVGIRVTGSSVLVQGNYVGTDVSGMAARPNGIGVFLKGLNTMLGGDTPAARNVISGNASHGISMEFLINAGPQWITPSNAQVIGNFIGVGMDGTTPLGNGGDGILSNARGTQIGGTNSGQANVIAYNAGSGVSITPVNPEFLPAATANTIRGNALFANAKLGIDLGANGPTPNDNLDADTGPNNLQNVPMLLSATPNAGAVRVAGSLHSSPNSTFRLDFYSNTPSQQTWQSARDVTTDAAGNVTFTIDLVGTGGAGSTVTATATDSQGNTSEFSNAALVPIPGDANADGAVSFADLVAVAQNYGGSNKSWQQGDFTGDGTTDFSDLVLLAQRYNTSLLQASSLAAVAAKAMSAVELEQTARAVKRRPTNSVFNATVPVQPTPPAKLAPNRLPAKRR
jgi:hypothetical protein